VEIDIVNKEFKNEMNMMIISEAEAASISCHYELSHGNTSIKVEEGENYMVIDAGGGTTDISVHKIQNGLIRETIPQVGINVGSTKLDSNYLNLLDTKYQLHVHQLKKNCPKEYFKLLNNWIKAKETNDESLAPELTPSIIKGKLSPAGAENVVDQRLNLSEEDVGEIYKETIERIIGDVEKILSELKDKNEKCKFMFLVGGLGQSKILLKTLKKKFEDKIEIIVPKSTGSSVLKGAVICGKDPHYVRYRKMRVTLGIEVSIKFNQDIHFDEENEVIYENGDFVLPKRFKALVIRGDDLIYGHRVRRSFIVPEEGDKLNINFYKTPYAISEGKIEDSYFKIRHVYTMEVDISHSPRPNDICVDVIFQSDDIIFEVGDEKGEKQSFNIHAVKSSRFFL